MCKDVIKNLSEKQGTDTIAASLYSFQASAFLAICSASALAFASMAKAWASPKNNAFFLSFWLYENNNKNCIN
jgi:hypothetical protein